MDTDVESTARVRRHAVLKRSTPGGTAEAEVEKFASVSLPPEVQSGNPNARLHAGEVSRRTNRQSTTLPPPESSPFSGESSNRASARRPRRANTQRGGFDSDSNSDNDDKRRKLRSDHDVRAARQGKRPEQSTPMPLYMEENTNSRDNQVDEYEERQHRYMQRTLRLLEEVMSHLPGKLDQIYKENDLIRALPSGEKSGAIKTETHDMMRIYVKRKHRDLFDDSLKAFMRQTDSSADTEEPGNTEEQELAAQKLRSYCKWVLKSGHVKYQFVEIHESLPRFILDLFGREYPPLLEYPVVFRVLIKDDKPMHAEPVSSYLLHTIGWNLTGTRWNRYWWSYQHGNTKFTENTIFRVRMNGQVDGVWSPGDYDPAFQSVERQQQSWGIF